MPHGSHSNALSHQSKQLHAFSNGAWFGLKVAGLIFCNVLVVLALLYAIDGVLIWIGKAFRINEFTLELIFSCQYPNPSPACSAPSAPSSC